MRLGRAMTDDLGPSGRSANPSAHQEHSLADEVDLLILRYERVRRRNQLLAFAARTATVGGSGSITVLVALQASGQPHPYLRFATLVLGVLVTIVAAWDVFFRPNELWTARTEAVWRLQNLRRRLRYGGTDDAAALVDLETILDDFRHTWTAVRRAVPSEVDRQITGSTPSSPT